MYKYASLFKKRQKSSEGFHVVFNVVFLKIPSDYEF